MLVLCLKAGEIEGLAAVQTVPCPAFTVGNPEGNYVLPGVLGEIPYRTFGGRTLLLDAYVHPGEKRPTVVIVHGGGWTSGSRLAYISQFQDQLARQGFNWVAPDYSLFPASIDDQLDDLESVLEFIRCHNGTLGVDTDRVVLLGEDTGAYLAGRLAARAASRLRGVVIVGGVYDLRESRRLARDPKLQRRLLGVSGAGILASRSLLRPPAAEYPPVLLVHGDRDSESSLGTAREFCRSAEETGTGCDLLVVEGGIHRAENWPPNLWGYYDDLAHWLRELVGDPGPHAAPQTSGRLRKDIAFSDLKGADGGALMLDAYVPEGPGPHPAVIVVHGGGWEAGSRITYIVPALKMLAEAGFAWFSVDYRLTPRARNEDQIEDVRRAVRFVRHNAARFRVDPQRLALLGESAGGQLVVQAAALPCPPKDDSADLVEKESCEVQAVVSYYGVYDFEPMVRDASPRSLLVRLFDHHQLDEQGRGLLRSGSPLYWVHGGMAPLLMVHGTDESLWDQAVRLAARLDEVGARYRLIDLEGAPHGMENWEGHPEWAYYKDAVTNWLRQVLR